MAKDINAIVEAEARVRAMADGDQISQSTRSAIQSLAIVVRELMERAEYDDTVAREANE